VKGGVRAGTSGPLDISITVVSIRREEREYQVKVLPLYVIMPTVNRRCLLARTLSSLASCALPARYVCTFVVENGSHRVAEAILQGQPSGLRIRYLHEGVANKSIALNRVLGELDEGMLLFLDDDVRISWDWLLAYEEATRNHSPFNFYGGPIGVDYDVPPPHWLLNYLPRSARGWSLPPGTTAVRGPEFLGFNWAASVHDLRRVGGFDIHRGPGAVTGAVGQETQMQVKLLQAGGVGQYVPNARVWHFVPAERCSPSWALQRTYREGVTSGMEMADDSRALFGVPRWIWLELSKRWVRASWQRLLFGNAHSFVSWRDYWNLRGVARGMRIQHLHQRAAVNPIPDGV
jgi:hypothetical protein